MAAVGLVTEWATLSAGIGIANYQRFYSPPTRAMTFGNLRDPASAVSRKADDPVRGYHALHVLNTRPATTYLAQVVRGRVEG